MNLTYVLGDQKNRLIETVLLSTHNIYILVEKSENLKLNFSYALFNLGPAFVVP